MSRYNISCVPNRNLLVRNAESRVCYGRRPINPRAVLKFFCPPTTSPKTYLVFAKSVFSRSSSAKSRTATASLLHGGRKSILVRESRRVYICGVMELMRTDGGSRRNSEPLRFGCGIPTLPRRHRRTVRWRLVVPITNVNF